MLGVECLSVVSSLFASDVRVRASLATRLLQFLELLVRDDEIRLALRIHFDFLASLSTFLQRHDAAGAPPAKDESTTRSIHLLQRITFGHDTRDESHRHLEFLVGLLVAILLNDDEGNSSSSSNSLLLPSLALLVNLSKNHAFVQSSLRHHINSKAFYKRLIACFSRNDDTAIIICAKSVFANLYLSNAGGGAGSTPVASDFGAANNNEARLAEKLFSPSNIRQTFQLVFNCMQKASSASETSSHSSLFAQSYGVDLLLTLLRIPTYANCFLAYDYRDAFCRGFFELLVHVHSRRKALKEVGFGVLGKFLELIRLLTEFEELKTTLAAASQSAADASATPPFFAALISLVEAGPKLMTRSSLTTALAAADVLERLRAIDAASSTTGTVFVEKVIPVCGRVLGMLSEQRPLDGHVAAMQTLSGHSMAGTSTNNGASTSTAPASKTEAPVDSVLRLAAALYRLLAAVIHLRDGVQAYQTALDFDLPLATVDNLMRHHVGGNGNLDAKGNHGTPWQEPATDTILQALKFLAAAQKVKGSGGGKGGGDCLG